MIRNGTIGHGLSLFKDHSIPHSQLGALEQIVAIVDFVTVRLLIENNIFQ